jgi:hypothetical protein
MAVTLNASTTTGLVQSADTSGNIELQSNGTTKATVSSSGLAIGQYNPSTSLVTSGTAVASTSGTSIDFTSIPSWVKRITVMFDGVSTNGSSLVCIQLGDSGGIETTGYNGGATNQSPTYTANTIGLNVLSGSSPSVSLMGQGVLTKISGNNWVFSAGIQLSLGNISAAGGSKTLSDTLDRIRITTLSGTETFDAGSINILYE